MKHNLLRSYEGKGRFNFINISKFEMEFELYFWNSGKIEVKAINNNFFSKEALMVIKKNSENRELIECQLNGILKDGGELNIDKLYINNIHMKWSKDDKKRTGHTFLLHAFSEVKINYSKERASLIRYGLANLQFGGLEFIKRNGKNERAKFDIKLGDNTYSFIKIKNYEEIIKEIKEKRSCNVTSEIISRNNISWEEELNKIINPICELLGFSQRNYITVLYVDIFDDKENKTSTILFNSKTYPYSGYDFCIDFRHLGNNDIEDYLQTCFEKYVELKNKLKINIIFEYSIQVHLIKLFDIDYLMLVIAFECLAYNGESFLKEKSIEIENKALEQNKQIIDSYLLKKGLSLNPEDIKELAKKLSYNQPSFKSKLKTIFDYFNVTYIDKDLDFIDIRNKLIHSGKFPENIQYPTEEYNKLVDFLDRVLLTILGFKGKYYISRLNQFKRIEIQ